jgi:hypothetical protein
MAGLASQPSYVAGVLQRTARVPPLISTRQLQATKIVIASVSEAIQTQRKHGSLRNTLLQLETRLRAPRRECARALTKPRRPTEGVARPSTEGAGRP